MRMGQQCPSTRPSAGGTRLLGTGEAEGAMATAPGTGGGPEDGEDGGDRVPEDIRRPAHTSCVSDDSASAASSMEVTDRIASLEQRVQMQEDEIQLLKSALADVVRRLNISEEQQALLNRKGPTKEPAGMRKSASADGSGGKTARPMIAALPLRPTVNNGTVLPKKTLPSPSGSKKDNNTPATKSMSSVSSLSSSSRYLLRPPFSTVKRTSSSEQVGPTSRKDSAGDAKNNRTRTGSTGSNSSSKRSSESKQREPVFSAGMRRVTHCKVTVQIYLHRPARGPASTEPPQSSSAVPSGSRTSPPEPRTPSCRTSRPGATEVPPFTPLLRKCPPQPTCSPLDTPTYRSPIKSPSQYFQICY
uniref:EMAP like 1 n=1 Tax=Astyanax mexicanus TaxID=7994 RepID=A0A3B1JR71_ASTMX